MKFLYSILLNLNKILYYFLIITFSFKNNTFCFDLTLTKSERNANIIRLNKLISIKNNISRRKSEKFIKDGNVKLNNKIVINPGQHVDITKDSLKICEKKIKIENIKNLINRSKNNEYKWIVLHKPKGMICTANDEKNRKSIFSIFPNDLLEKYRFVSV
ncbi:pseudouridine synthase, putative, partial [Plasmodium relictum]